MLRLGRCLAVLVAVAALACPSPSAAADPTVFVAPLNQPLGVAVGPGGDVYATHDGLDTTWLVRFSAAAQLLGARAFGDVLSAQWVGTLARDPGTGLIWDLTQDGRLFTVDPETLEPRLVGTIVGADARQVFDVSEGRVRDLSGSIVPPASFGDIALLRTGERLDVFVTGKTNNLRVYYVLRVSFVSGAAPTVRAIVASTATSIAEPPTPPDYYSIARGVAVNGRGLVLTTLPLEEPTDRGTIDVPVSFPAAYPEAGGAVRVARSGPDLGSRGMDVDAQGNFYAVGLIGSSACGVAASGAIFVLSPDAVPIACRPLALLAQARDVAVAPGGDVAYTTIYAFQGAILRWGGLAPPTEELRVERAGVGSGVVASTPAGIDCGVLCAARFARGASVTLTARADEGSEFGGWSGGGCDGSGECTVVLDGAKTVVGHFVRSAAGPPGGPPLGTGQSAASQPGTVQTTEGASPLGPPAGLGGSVAPASARLLTGSARLRRGRVPLRLHCAGNPGDRRCDGTLTLLRRRRTWGRSDFAIVAGDSATVRVPLTRRARRGAWRRVRLIARVTTVEGSVAPVTTRTPIVVRRR
jgi:hypothetical protein